MNTRFLTLFTLRVTHSYYGGEPCQDFDFIIAEHSRRVLQSARLLTRMQAGQLHVLFEAGEDNQPVQDIAGLELLVGLRLRNPYFEYFTAALPEPFPLYANAGTPKILDAPQASDLIAHRFMPVAAMTQRPLTISVLQDDAPRWSGEIGGESMPKIDMHAWDAGCYLVTQQSAAGTKSRPLIVAPDLAEAGMWGAVRIRISSDLWNSPAPPDFHIGFAARKEPLNYYVVAPSLWPDFNQLSVVDAAKALLFERLEPGSFPPDSLSPALLGVPDTQVVLFRSTTPVSRRTAASLHLQLKCNGDTLVKNLPLPGADTPSSRVVIHLSKP